MNRYHEYRDSGMGWIGQIPSTWSLTPLKRLVTIGNGRDYKHIETEINGYPVYGTGGVFTQCSEYLHVGPSVLLGRKGTIDNPLFVEGPFWTSDTIYYTDIDQQKVIPKYLFYLVHQIPFGLYKYGSTIPSMTKTDYEEMRFPHPSIPEQHQIVSFLDEKTSQIDDLIEKKKRKIELLKEYRSSLISHVVTKGLDPNVEMKDSGVEWVGEIPNLWETKRLRFLITSKPDNGIFKKKDQFGSGIRLVNVGDLYNESNVVSQSTLNRVVVDSSEITKYSVQEGDVFFVRSSLKEEGVGVSSMIDKLEEETVFECHIVRIRPSVKVISPWFLKYYLNSPMVRQRLVSLSNTVTMSTLSQEKFTGLEIVVPDIQSQIEIVQYLDYEIGKVHQLVEIEHRSIKLLEEYRQSLISEVVTGKIKVTD